MTSITLLRYKKMIEHRKDLIVYFHRSRLVVKHIYSDRIIIEPSEDTNHYAALMIKAADNALEGYLKKKLK